MHILNFMFQPVTEYCWLEHHGQDVSGVSAGLPQDILLHSLQSTPGKSRRTYIQGIVLVVYMVTYKENDRDERRWTECVKKGDMFKTWTVWEESYILWCNGIYDSNIAYNITSVIITRNVVYFYLFVVYKIKVSFSRPNHKYYLSVRHLSLLCNIKSTTSTYDF